MVVKIWVDDLRARPGWDWVQAWSSSEAILLLENCRDAEFDIELISLDHDLGGDDTSRPIVLWMCENEWWPEEVVVHSQNPVGREWLQGMIARYKV